MDPGEWGNWMDGRLKFKGRFLKHNLALESLIFYFLIKNGVKIIVLPRYYTNICNIQKPLK